MWRRRGWQPVEIVLLGLLLLARVPFRAHLTHPQLPIIAVTARAMPGDRDKSLSAGASDYVTKPVNTDELLSCMERWLSRSRA